MFHLLQSVQKLQEPLETKLSIIIVDIIIDFLRSQKKNTLLKQWNIHARPVESMGFC